MKPGKEYQKHHVINWKRSGLSMKQYCKEQKIFYWSFREWKITWDSIKSSGLVEVAVSLCSKPGENEPLEIILKNGLRIIVKENSGTCRLKEIISILEGLS